MYRIKVQKKNKFKRNTRPFNNEFIVLGLVQGVNGKIIKFITIMGSLDWQCFKKYCMYIFDNRYRSGGLQNIYYLECLNNLLSPAWQWVRSTTKLFSKGLVRYLGEIQYLRTLNTIQGGKLVCCKTLVILKNIKVFCRFPTANIKATKITTA